MRNPVAISWVSVWFQGTRYLLALSGIRGFSQITVQVYYTGQTGWSHLKYSCLSNLPMICISVFLLTIFELLGQLVCGYPPVIWLAKLILLWKHARVHWLRSFCSFYRRLPFPSMLPWIGLCWELLPLQGDIEDLRPGLESDWLILLTLVIGSVMLPRVASGLSWLPGDHKAVNKMPNVLFDL